MAERVVSECVHLSLQSVQPSVNIISHVQQQQEIMDEVSGLILIELLFLPLSTYNYVQYSVFLTTIDLINLLNVSYSFSLHIPHALAEGEPS